MLNAQFRSLAPERDPFGTDEERLLMDFEENQRRRRELILSYHRQYAEKKLGRKFALGRDGVIQNEFQDREKNNRMNNDRPFSRSDVNGNQSVIENRLGEVIPNMNSGAHAQNGMDNFQMKEYQNDFNQRQKYRNINDDEFGPRFVQENSMGQSYNVGYKGGDFDNGEKATTQNETSFNYLADDIPMCENSAGTANDVTSGHSMRENCEERDEKTSVSENCIDTSNHYDEFKQGQMDSPEVVYPQKRTNQGRGESGYWSQTSTNGRSLDESENESSNENIGNISNGQSSHNFHSQQISLDVFDDPMN